MTFMLIQWSDYCGHPVASSGPLLRPEIGVFGFKIDSGWGLMISSSCTRVRGSFVEMGGALSWLHRWSDFHGALPKQKDYLGLTADVGVGVSLELGAYVAPSDLSALFTIAGGFGY
jgi:hypothetical protein